eukprot:GHRQ01013841.1.p2 GENE.GHRQ01013841.1~~GHRQ01013841.1.p2  ORF type:complete len:123 (+),score=31.29 GHRQ01013841.1:872-1240(+)
MACTDECMPFVSECYNNASTPPRLSLQQLSANHLHYLSYGTLEYSGWFCWPVLRRVLLPWLQVVDLVMLSTFADLEEASVDSDPLLLLPCGHVFTTSTLDGWMDMAAAYERAAPGACAQACM